MNNTMNSTERLRDIESTQSTKQIVNGKLQAFKTAVKNKKAAVLGIGISNTPLIRILHD